MGRLIAAGGTLRTCVVQHTSIPVDDLASIKTLDLIGKPEK
jgi:hypothetical protein